MEILIEYFNNFGQPLNRSILTKKPNIGELVEIDQKYYRISDCRLNHEIWESSGMISFACKIEPDNSNVTLRRIASRIAEESPLQISTTDVMNCNHGFGMERGDKHHDDNFIYLVLGVFVVDRDIDLFEKELSSNGEIESPFDLKFVWSNGEEYILNKNFFKLRLTFPWTLTTPKILKETDGHASAVIEAIVEKGKYPLLEKFYNDGRGAIYIDGDLPYDEYIDLLNRE